MKYWLCIGTTTSFQVAFLRFINLDMSSWIYLDRSME